MTKQKNNKPSTEQVDPPFNIVGKAKDIIQRVFGKTVFCELVINTSSLTSHKTRDVLRYIITSIAKANFAKAIFDGMHFIQIQCMGKAGTPFNIS